VIESYVLSGIGSQRGDTKLEKYNHERMVLLEGRRYPRLHTLPQRSSIMKILFGFIILICSLVMIISGYLLHGWTSIILLSVGLSIISYCDIWPFNFEKKAKLAKFALGIVVMWFGFCFSMYLLFCENDSSSTDILPGDLMSKLILIVILVCLSLAVKLTSKSDN
jgi:hypothetical protein